MIDLAPRCHWCGKPFHVWERAKIHMKHCEAAPNPRRRHKPRMQKKKNSAQGDLFAPPAPPPPPKFFQCRFNKLTTERYQAAMHIGDQRQDNAENKGLVGQNNQDPKKARRDHRLGALGEINHAVLEHFEFKYSDFKPNGQKPADFGNRDIKTTQKHCVYLAMQKYDPVEHIYILARANFNDLVVEECGWERGEVIKQPKNWGDWMGTGRKCYGVHKDKLQPMSTLPPAYPLR